MTDPARPRLSCGPVADPTSVDPFQSAPFTQQGNTWGTGTAVDQPTACVDAMYGAGAEWDMLRDWLGAKGGFDGQGHAAPIGLGWFGGAHFDPEGQPGGSVKGPVVILGYVDTLINGPMVRDPEEMPPVLKPPSNPELGQLTTIDVVAHEFGHLVFQTTPGSANFSSLENSALNEGTADILAQLTIAFANNPNVPLTYAMGSQFRLPFRVMYDPPLGLEGGVACYSPGLFTNLNGEPVVRDQNGNPAPHPFAGPLNHWFYLLAEGSNPAGRPASHTCDLSTLNGLGIKLAGQIFYNGLLQKTPTWTYRDARSATLASALQMFPGTCAVFDKVKAAWNAVSVPALPNEPTCGVTPPTPAPTPAPILPPVVPPTAARLTPGLPTTGMIVSHSQSGMARAVPVALGGVLLLPLLSLAQWRWRRSRRKG